VDCRGPNNAANAHLVTDGDVNTPTRFLSNKFRFWVPWRETQLSYLI
jgi:hypothetical protein